MSLTAAEETRIASLEDKAVQLTVLVKNTASKNMLNRLLVLAQEQTGEIKTRIEALETQMTTLLAQARKLQ